MIEIGLGHYLSLGAIIFFLGTIGIFLNRKNVIVILMSIELILLAVNINLISFSIFSGDIVGQIFTMLILTVAAAEAAIGLAIIVIYYRNKGSIRVEGHTWNERINGIRCNFSSTLRCYYWIFGRFTIKIFFRNSN
jgi:NADH-quinone oxidoreductase subunit K